jgi:uncharacterized Tic20 family protein
MYIVIVIALAFVFILFGTLLACMMMERGWIGTIFLVLALGLVVHGAIYDLTAPYNKVTITHIQTNDYEVYDLPIASDRLGVVRVCTYTTSRWGVTRPTLTEYSFVHFVD